MTAAVGDGLGLERCRLFVDVALDCRHVIRRPVVGTANRRIAIGTVLPVGAVKTLYFEYLNLAVFVHPYAVRRSIVKQMTGRKGKRSQAGCLSVRAIRV